MKALEKVIWAEGVMLGQQHLQQWDQYHETVQRLLSKIYAPLGWGIHQLEIDEQALENGLLRIVNCQIILPNGRLLVHSDDSQAPLSFDLLKQKRQSYGIYLCVAANDKVSDVTGYLSTNELSSDKAKYIEVADVFDADRKREVMIAKPNLLLMSQDDPRDNYYSIQIAQVLRTGEQEFELDKKFIPTVTNFAVSPVLQNCVRRISESLEAKIKVLIERRRSFSGDVTEFGQSDLAHFLLLEALQEQLPILKHYQQLQLAHPENLYLSISSLLGRLQAFHDDSIDIVNTQYHHSNLSETFSALEHNLKKLMHVVLPTRVVKVDLERETDALYSADNIDSHFLQDHSFFIAVYMNADDTSWIDQFAQHIKVGSRQQIEEIIASALPGVKITHLQRPPSKLPIKTGYEYFRIEPYGPYWQRVQADRSLGLFVSQQFSVAKLDLVTVKE